MEKIEFEGQVYLRTGSKWTDSRSIVVHEVLQKKLNRLYLETLDFSTFSVKELVREGDKFKQSSSYEYAIAFYEKATRDCDETVLQYVLPRITSCYRKCNQPQKVIDLFSFAKNKFGETFITPVLLTSVAAAYCDLKEYDRALRCCKWAYKRYGGEIDPNLHSVWRRIEKESGIEQL